MIVPVMELFTLPTSIPEGRTKATRPDDVVSHPINNVVIAKQAIIEKKRFI